MPKQIDLFDIAQAYAGTSTLSNKSLYKKVAPNSNDSVQPVGKCGQKHNILNRKIRWYQQDLKRLGLLEPSGNRSEWRLTDAGKRKFERIKAGQILLAFSTDLGIALWGDCKDIFRRLDGQEIHLCLTSPPYPLRKPRAYGNPPESEYIDFICSAMEPIIKNMAKSGSICLNLSNDIFLAGLPARSLYRERLVIALHDRLGLFKMDELIWHNPCKPPGPMEWASKTRQQLNVGWEPIYWFCLDPKECRSNNRRVLQPHTEKHLKFIEAGGVTQKRISSDGAYAVKEGSYSNPTSGRIPRNLLTFPHNCVDQRAYKKAAKDLGVQAHGASYPLGMAKFIIEFMTQKDDLVVDPMAGSFTTAKAAQELGRRWLASDVIYDYAKGGAERFKNAPEFTPYI
jgi:DNA modification methylase